MRRNTIKTKTLALFAVALLIAGHASTVLASKPSEISDWTTEANSLPATRTEMGTAEYNGYVYLVAGSGAANSDSTVYAKIQESGSVGEWQTSAHTLPSGNFRLTSVAHNGYLYAIGGRDGGALTSIYRAQLDSDTGAPGAWAETANPLPVGLYYANSFVFQNYLYIIGGDDHSGAVNTVYSAPIQEDHTIGTWEQSSDNLPVEIALGTVIVHEDYVYIIGGRDDEGALDSVYYAVVAAGGSIGNWVSTNQTLPQPLWGASSVIMGDDIFVFGGNNGTSRLSTVYTATIGEPGTLSAFTTAPSLPVVTESSGAITYGGDAYVFGGVGSGFLSGVYSTSDGISNEEPEEDSSAGTQIVFPDGDDSKAILLEQEEGTEICDAFEGPTFTRQESQLEVQDSSYDYSSHFIGFTMTGCEVGGTTTMRLIFTGSFDPVTTAVRKYNAVTKQYDTIDATKTATTLNDLPALEVTYEITDGGTLDQDGLANGTIVDPVGLGVQASASSSSLADTGQSANVYISVAALLSVSSLALITLRKRISVKI